MEGDVENARSSMEHLEGSASDKQLRFYRAMTQDANNLVECLQEKVVEINLLELELHTLLADQMESLLADRRKSVRERAAHLQQPYNIQIRHIRGVDNVMADALSRAPELME